MKFHALKIAILLLFVQHFTIHAKDLLYNDVSFYIAAHEDDWQLFMGTNVANDIISGEKVVIIHVTAGDLDGLQTPWGYDNCTQNQDIPYYRVREIGAEYSMHLMAESSGWTFTPNPTISFPVIENHPIRRYEYRNVVMYFMRLVDSHLSWMANDHMVPGQTIDNSSTYENWCDLTNTLATILRKERVNHNTGWLNIPDIDQGLNPNDHGSHYSAGLAALYAVKFVIGENYPTALFVDYDTKNRPVNLGHIDLANESGMSAAYNISLIYHHIWNEWRTPDNIFQEWCSRNYYRIENSDDVPVEYWDCCRECRPVYRNEEDLHLEKNLLYPNPNTGLMTINVKEETDENSIVEVLDLDGKVIFKAGCQQNVPIMVDMRSHPQGAYKVQITTKSGMQTKKVIAVRE